MTGAGIEPPGGYQAPRPALELPLLLVIAAGGALGSVARWGLGQACMALGDGTGWSTSLVNVLGCLGIGVLHIVLNARPAVHRYVQPFLGIGVLGGLTTFSTYVLQGELLAKDGQLPLALIQLVGTVLVGLLAVAMGSALGRHLVSTPTSPPEPP